MFGILSAPCRAHTPRLAAEYAPFYCGLATSLERLFGYPARIFAGRDAVVLGIVRSALSSEPPTVKRLRCCNPLGSAKLICVDSKSCNFAAATTILGLDTKLRDNG